MKYSIIILLLFTVLIDKGQMKSKLILSTIKEFKWPYPIRDSTWAGQDFADTIWGMITIPVSGGFMSARGFVRSSFHMTCHMLIYLPKDRSSIDSFIRAGGIADGPMCIGDGQEIRTAYIKTNSGYKQISGHFTYQP